MTIHLKPAPNYPSSTPEETRASLADLMRRRDAGLIGTDDYLAIRRRLVLAALSFQNEARERLEKTVRAADWEGRWGDVFNPLKIAEAAE